MANVPPERTASTLVRALSSPRFRWEGAWNGLDFLLLAGLCEIGWPVGLKLGWTAQGLRPLWILFGVVCILASGALLLLAQREVPMGTAYAVWTGIGAVGAFLVGVWAFGDPGTLMRSASVGLIVLGIIGLKIG